MSYLPFAITMIELQSNFDLSFILVELPFEAQVVLAQESQAQAHKVLKGKNHYSTHSARALVVDSLTSDFKNLTTTSLEGAHFVQGPSAEQNSLAAGLEKKVINKLCGNGLLIGWIQSHKTGTDIWDAVALILAFAKQSSRVLFVCLLGENL